MSTGKYKELTVNTVLFAVSSFGARLVSFLLLPLYTSVLSTADYGTVDLMTSTVSLLVPVLTVNVQDAVLRFTLGKEAAADRILAVGLRTVAAGACVLLAAEAALVFFRLSPVDDIYLAFLLVSFLLTSLSNVLTMYVKAQDQVRSLVVSGIGSTLVTCTLAVILLVVVKAGVLGYMAAMTAGSLFTVVVLAFAGRVSPRAIGGHLPAGLAKAMLVYSAPLIANGLAWWVNDVSDRYVVTLICGAAANGVYAVAFKIPTILSTLQSIFYNAWSISAIKEFDSNDRDGFLGRMYSLYSCAMSLCCSVILLLDVPLAHLLYANEFFEAWRYVPFLLVGVYLNGLALFEGCIFGAAKCTREVSTTTVMGAIASIASCVALTSAFGPIGAAAATLLGYLVTWSVRTTVMVKRVARIRVSWLAEIACIVILVVQALLATQDGNQLAQLVALMALFIVQRDKIVQIAGFIYRKLEKSKSSTNDAD